MPEGLRRQSGTKGDCDAERSQDAGRPGRCHAAQRDASHGVEAGRGREGHSRTRHRRPSREARAARPVRQQGPGHVRPHVPEAAAARGERREAEGARRRDARPRPGATPRGDNPNIPAGFTYLGQFVDHDITLDLTSLCEKDKDPLGIENFRTPSLDLDAVYGLGPDGSPHLYARNPANTSKHGPKLLIGKNINVGFGGVTGDFRNDLPRSPEGFALIGDHRNDENLLVAQTHLAFLKFHNKVCDLLAGSANPPADIFAEARRTVTWHYQWMVLHDFVERLTEPGIVARILHDGRKFYRFKKTPYMPVEFSAAAYRLGHSMVRQTYSHNRVFQKTGFDLLFGFSGLSGEIIGDLAPNPPTGAPAGSGAAEQLDHRLAPLLRSRHAGRHARLRLQPRPQARPVPGQELHTLPGGGGNLAFRNMKRGVNLGLPSGQDVAKAMKIKNPLTAAEIASGPDGARRQAAGPR